MPYSSEDFIKHYNCGDLSSIIFSHDSSQVPNFINATLLPQERITAQEIDSYFRRQLIHKRDERMGKRVKALLEEFPDKDFFFAFGAEARVKAPHCVLLPLLAPEAPTPEASLPEAGAAGRSLLPPYASLPHVTVPGSMDLHRGRKKVPEEAETALAEAVASAVQRPVPLTGGECCGPTAPGPCSGRAHLR